MRQAKIKCPHCQAQITVRVKSERDAAVLNIWALADKVFAMADEIFAATDKMFANIRWPR